MLMLVGLTGRIFSIVEFLIMIFFFWGDWEIQTRFWSWKLRALWLQGVQFGPVLDRGCMKNSEKLGLSWLGIGLAQFWTWYIGSKLEFGLGGLPYYFYFWWLRYESLLKHLTFQDSHFMSQVLVQHTNPLDSRAGFNKSNPIHVKDYWTQLDLSWIIVDLNFSTNLTWISNLINPSAVLTRPNPTWTYKLTCF